MNFELVAFYRCIDKRDPSATLPGWWCDIAFLPFFVIGGIMGLVCLLFPSYARPYLRTSDIGPKLDKDWQIRIVGSILLIGVVYFIVEELRV